MSVTEDTTEQQQCISDEDITVDSDTLPGDKAAEPPPSTGTGPGPYAPPQTTAVAAGEDGDDAPADTEEAPGVRQRAMYARFRSWTLRNYGESGKTKTVTRAKYERVVAILSGVEPPTADNSKLRFWIKAKGFRLGYPVDTDPPTIVNHTELYIPSKTWVRLIKTCVVIIINFIHHQLLEHLKKKGKKNLTTS